jgi:hypothetical protein
MSRQGGMTNPTTKEDFDFDFEDFDFEFDVF